MNASKFTAWGVIRGLGASDEIRIVAVDRDRYAPGLYSKYVAARYLMDYGGMSLTHDSSRLRISELLSLCKKEDVDLVFPTSDNDVYWLSRYKEELSRRGISVPVPDFEVAILLLDKLRMVEYAEEHHIPCPKSSAVSDKDSLLKVAEDLGYPLVLKPRLSSGARGLTYVRGKTELLEKWKRISRFYGQPVVQEFIPGEDSNYQVATVWDNDHRLAASCTFRKVREYPLSGGIASAVLTVKNPEIHEYGIRLLEATRKWVGVAVPEFKVDARDGVPKLMDGNPRVSGTIQLAVSSKVNIPLIAVNTALGKEVKEDHEAEPGKLLIKLWFDLGILGLTLMNCKANLGELAKLPLGYLATYTYRNKVIEETACQDSILGHGLLYYVRNAPAILRATRKHIDS